MRGMDVDMADRLKRLRAFLTFSLKRFSEDRCLRMAASLSYTSLLAIVPLTAIAFSMLAAFPVFEGIRDEFQTALFSNFLPQSAQAMREYFDQFVANTARLTAVGIVGLAATAVLLLGTIEADLNAIFRVARARAMIPRLLVFWALITLGPILLGASFSLSTYFFALTRWVGVETDGNFFAQFTQYLPTFMVIVALTLCYIIVPNRRVSFKDAVIGGILAGVLFGLLRQGFGLYVSKFPTYQTIYGAVSVIPIFLVWMYMSWAVVLFGAVTTAALGEWRTGSRKVGKGLRPEDNLIATLHILERLFQASRTGDGLSRQRLLKDTALSGNVLELLLGNLEKHGYADQTAARGWVIVRDLSSVTLYALLKDLDLTIDPEAETAGIPWKRNLRDRLSAINLSTRSDADVLLRDLLDGGSAAETSQVRIAEAEPLVSSNEGADRKTAAINS
ncbi:MAG: YihY family inner membrane protein [Rhodospirillales bacterium]|nr:YihY family inner membrane protein [Rhodospirillales bacterium]